MNTINQLVVAVALLCMIAMLAGCAARPDTQTAAGSEMEDMPTPVALAGTEWTLEDLGGSGVLDNAQATLLFSKDYPTDGKISGNGSCNKFSGTAKLDAGQFSVGPLATTRMACAPAVDDQETRYLKALQGAERLAFNGPYLFLYAKDLERPLRFIKKSGE
jgi:heat shock protein HslJ